MLRLCGLSCLLLILTACAATPPPLPDSRDWSQHRVRLAALEAWELRGKMVLRTDDSAETARLRWTQRGDHLSLEISGPLGVKPVILEAGPGTAGRVYRDGEWRPLEASLQAMEQETGWALPLAHLPWWLRGLPSPHLPTATVALEDGRLSRLVQDAWELDYAAFQTQAGVALPGSIRFTGPGLSGRILLSHWDIAQ